jgi:hypothetical protein
MNDKRAQFFVVAALVCLALLPVAEAQFRTITLVVAGTYLVLALASWLDSRRGD